MNAAQATVVEALREHGLLAHAEGAGVYVQKQGHLTVAEAAVLATELDRGLVAEAESESEDEGTAKDFVAVLTQSLELVGDLAVGLLECHAALREGIRTINVLGEAAPCRMGLAIERTQEVLGRARDYSPRLQNGEVPR